MLWAGWKGLDFVLRWGGSESANSPIARFVRSRGFVALPPSPAVLGSSPAAARPAPLAGDADDDPDAAVMISHDSRPSGDWRFQGRVFDLVTLKPLSRCEVDFEDPASGKRFETSTDGDGVYRARIPALPRGGYAVKVRLGGYAPSYLNPETENVAGMSEEERRTLARDLLHSLDGPYTVQAAGGEPVDTDFYLAAAR